MKVYKYLLILVDFLQSSESETINATTYQQFYEGTINCTQNEECTVNCIAEQACKSSTINCPLDKDCYVTCTDVASCHETTINCPQLNGDAACEVTSISSNFPDAPFTNTIVNANYTNNPVFTCSGVGACFQSEFFNCHGSSDGTMTVYTQNNPSPTGTNIWINWYPMYLAS